MRAVSFVQHQEFQFKGNVSKNAVTLGDVDNDKDGELVIGNLLGHLAIFKYQQVQPWAEAQGLGMIMVVIVGDVLNEGKNSLIAISGEGSCHIFNVKNDYSLEEEKKNLLPFHIQCLPANTKVAMLADVDGDGNQELVLGLTDHVLRTYRWVKICPGSADMKGKLVGLHKWEFANQIGSISLNPSEEGNPDVLVAQPGGTYINFQCPTVHPDSEDNLNDSLLISKLTPKHHPLASSRMRNPNISSEILGGIQGVVNEKSTSSLIAIVTLDGTLMLLHGEDIMWSLQVDHQLFSLTKLDLIGDGHEEVIACAWDGQTYMVNQKRESVRFQFEEPVCTFTSGHYSVSPGKSVPVLVYVTFSDRIYLYYDVMLPFFKTCDFIETMQKQPEVEHLLKKLNIDPSDRQQLRDLYKRCLYEFPKTRDEDKV